MTQGRAVRIPGGGILRDRDIFRYLGGVPLPDVLIRNVPGEDLTLLDEQAARLGISRTEYLHRHLHREARRTARSVTAADLRAVAELLPDLADDKLMSDAWS